MSTSTGRELTSRQQVIFDLRELPIEEIAEKTGISESGVYGHIRRIKERGYDFEIVHSSNGASAQTDEVPPLPEFDGSDPLDNALAELEVQIANEVEIAKELDARTAALEAAMRTTTDAAAQSKYRLGCLQTAKEALDAT